MTLMEKLACQVNSRVISPDVIAEIRTYLPGTFEFSHHNDDHNLSYRMSAKPDVAIGCFGAQLGPQATEVGDIVSFPPGIPLQTSHCLSQLTRVVIIQISPQKFGKFLHEENCSLKLEAMASLNLQNPLIRHDMRVLGQEIMTPGIASRYLIDSIASSLMVHLARHFNKAHSFEPAVKGGLAPSQLRHLKELLHNSEREILPNVNVLADSINVSTRHLRRAFQESTGIRISEYVRAIRLERAKSLLSHTDISIGDIATQLGFSAAYSFRAAFQRETGYTPRSYKKLNRKISK